MGSFPCSWWGLHNNVGPKFLYRKIVMKKLYVICGTITALTLIACGVSSKPTSDDTNRLNNQTSGATSHAAKAPVKKQITSGSWEVGKKENLDAGIIAPGIYLITGLDDGVGCYWETVKNFDNSLDSIIANDNVDPGATARVNVKSSYAGLILKNDCLAAKK